MDNSPRYGFSRWLVRLWIALRGRTIRLLKGEEMTAYGPALYAVGHTADFFAALVMWLAVERPVRCLLPSQCVNGAFSRWLAHYLNFIVFDGKDLDEPAMREAVDDLVSGEALVIFSAQNDAPAAAAHSLVSTVAQIVQRAETERPSEIVAVYPVHLYLPASSVPSRELLVYVDTALSRPEGWSAARRFTDAAPPLAAELESRLQENAFQLRPADLQFFLGDLEDLLRTGLQEEWASLPDWKQDAEGFVLSRYVVEWVRQANYLDSGSLVALRASVDNHRRLQKQCAQRELEVDGGDAPLGAGWRRMIAWIEALLGLPIAVYGAFNHLLIGFVLFLAGSFKPGGKRSRRAEWILRGSITLLFYVLQTYLVAHWWGRAAAGYYAPSLPISGAYLWRYAGLVRPQARLLFISLTIPGLKKKIERQRQIIVESLDRTLNPISL